MAVAMVTPHPQFNISQGPYTYDFSILTLAQAATLSSTVAPACLPPDITRDYAGQVYTHRCISIYLQKYLY